MAVKGTVSIVFVMLYLAMKIARSFIYLSQFRLHVSFTHAHSITWQWKRTGAMKEKNPDISNTEIIQVFQSTRINRSYVRSSR